MRKQEKIMNSVNRILPFLCLAIVLSLTGCFLIDDSGVAKNTYSINGITTPVDETRTGGVNASGSAERQVNIGHNLPVNITLDAEYAEDDVPVQIYLLNMNDIEEVQAGIGDAGDIRMYYIYQTENTTIDSLLAGTNTYLLSINIPADQAEDELTGDYKTGEFCVVGEVDKDGDAETDAYKVYRKFESRLSDNAYRNDNTIFVTTVYTGKPDLSIVEMKFTGGDESPADVLTFLDLDLGNLPGADNFTIQLDDDGEIENPLATPLHLSPSRTDRTFMGSIKLLSSSCDALNVPVVFTLERDADGEIGTAISIDLQIYDPEIGGWVETYYVPILQANVTERVNLALRIPDDGDEAAEQDARGIREYIGDGDDVYKSYAFQVVGHINPDGSVDEARFMTSKEDNYVADGSNSKYGNNIAEQDMYIAVDRMEVEANEGIVMYPYEKKTDPEKEDKQLVIFWDGFDYSVGDDDFGARAELHEGCLFMNFSLYSFGAYIGGSVFGRNMTLVNTYLNALCSPNRDKVSAYDFHVEAGGNTYLSDFDSGYASGKWEYPYTLYSKDFEKSFTYACFVFTVKAGIDLVINPGLSIDLESDGSLDTTKSLTFVASVDADASASLAGLASIGVYTYCDVLTLELEQSTGTKTELTTLLNDYNEEYPAVKGYVYRNFGFYLTGPSGYLNLYLEIDFILFSKRWSWRMFSYSCPRIPLIEFNIYDNTWDFTDVGDEITSGAIKWTYPKGY